MEIKKQIHALPNGKQIIIRTFRLDDSREIIKHKINVAKTTIFMNRLEDEVDQDIESTKAIVEKFNNDPMACFVGAFINDRLVGSFAIRPLLNLAKTKHRASFGISVDSEYRHLGIGKKMIETMIDIARQIGFDQIELDVVTTNNVAKHLYQSYGFVKIGIIPRAYKMPDGTYLDFENMVLFLK